MAETLGPAKRSTGGPAFTLIELLVVIAILCILAALLLPVLNRAKQRGQGAFCLNNLGQLQAAWGMYADDFQQRLVLNHIWLMRNTTVPLQGDWP